MPAQLPLPLLTLSGFWLQFAGLLLRGSLVVELEVSLMRRLVFYHVLCSSSGACRFRSLPCSRFPWGFSGHRMSVLLLPWRRRLGICPSLLFLCFCCSGWFAGVSWVLHPVSGCSSWGGVCSLDDTVVTLLAFPYLRVDELLDSGVYGVSWLQKLRSRLPFVVRPPFHISVCPSPALGLRWIGHRSVTPPAAHGFWALLEFRLRRSDA